MERILKKGGEYYQCVTHMHFRGMGDVIKECVPIVRNLRDAGHDFYALKKYLEKEAGHAIELGKDPFIKEIKAIFDAEKPEPK